MIRTLAMKNFKSIKQLEANTKKINVFIGEPNTGKSNILEALGIFSFGFYSNYGRLADFVRFEKTANLFYDGNLDEGIEVKFDIIVLKVEFNNGRFEGEWNQGQIPIAKLVGDYNNLAVTRYPEGGALSPFKFYRFPPIKQSFGGPESDFLRPPSGENLLSLLLSHKELKSTATQIFSHFGLRLVFRPQEGKIEVL